MAGVYRLFEDFGVVLNENMSGQCEGQVFLVLFLVLDIDPRQG